MTQPPLHGRGSVDPSESKQQIHESARAVNQAAFCASIVTHLQYATGALNVYYYALFGTSDVCCTKAWDICNTAYHNRNTPKSTDFCAFPGEHDCGLPHTVCMSTTPIGRRQTISAANSETPSILPFPRSRRHSAIEILSLYRSLTFC